MVTVRWDDNSESYWVMSSGRVLSERQSSSAAKNAGKREGRRLGEAVSYKGPRMSSAKYIQSAPNESSNNQSNGSMFSGIF